MKYKQPYQGGQVTKKKLLLTLFPKVRQFAFSKLFCAIILRRTDKIYSIRIASEVIHCELTMGKESSRGRDSTELLDYYVNTYCHFTLVTHGVNFHVDRGKGTNTSFLENRVVFVSNRNVKEPYVPEGRGYCGEDKFQYALIDW